MLAGYVAKDESVQVPEALTVKIPMHATAHNFQSYVADTLTRFSGALGSVTRGAAILEARIASTEQKLYSMQEKQVEVVRMQSKLVNSLSTHERALGELQIFQGGCLRKLESTSDATEKRLSDFEHQHRLTQNESNERAIKTSEALAEVQNQFKEQLGEYAAVAARDLDSVERELEACRHRISSLQHAERPVAPAASTGELNLWLDDALADTCARVEDQIANAGKRLSRHVESESKITRERYDYFGRELMQTWEYEIQQTAIGLQAEMRAEKERHSQELANLFVNIEKAAQYWVERIQDGQFDFEPRQTPSSGVARERWIERVRNGLHHASCAMEHMTHCANPLESDKPFSKRRYSPSSVCRRAKSLGGSSAAHERRRCHCRG